MSHPAPPQRRAQAKAQLTRAEVHAHHGRLDTLDGIRTIAVMLVVLFHVSVPGLEAGFLGVDVFFVLSGYLITTLLIREIGKTGRIDLLRFWSRRVLRLMPASLLVIAVVIVWGLLAAPAYQRPSLGQDVLWSLLYVANWRFISSSGYFANDGTQSPLQHVWSLAVEEQFYLGWPILLSVVVLLFLRRALRPEDPGEGEALTRARNLRTVAVAAGVVAVFQVVLSAAALWLLYDPKSPDRAYMGTDAKAFEPLLGALFAALIHASKVRRFVTRYAELLMYAGLFGILGGVLQLADAHGPKSSYFSGGALVFSLLTAFLVVGAAHTRDDFGLGRVLAWAPMAYLGRISYGIYLWHWPLAVWAGTHPQWVPLKAAGVVGATIVLAMLSYHLMEQPIRRGRPGHAAPWRVLSVGAAFIAAIALSVGALGGTPVSSIVPPIQAAEPNRSLVVVGDSVARRLVPGLEQATAARGLTVLSAARGGCPSLGTNVVGEDGGLVNGVDCATDVPKVQREVLAQTLPRAVLWWSRYELADRQGPDGEVLKAGTPAFWAAQQASLEQTVERLTATGAVLVIVEVDRVGLGIATRCTPGDCPGFLRALRDDDVELRQRWNAIVRGFAAKDDRVRVIRMDDLYCRTTGNPCDDSMPMRAAVSATANPTAWLVAGPPGGSPTPGPDGAVIATSTASAAPGAAPANRAPGFGRPDGTGFARPDGSHFSDTATPAVCEALIDRALAVLG